MKLVDELMAQRDVAQPIFTTDKLCKYYSSDRNDGLENIDIQLRDGEFVALLGPSGSGKSTLLRMLAGLIIPSSGAIYFNDELVTSPLTSVNIVFQHYALLPWLTVNQNISIGLNALSRSLGEVNDRLAEVVEMIGLQGYEENYPSELSGGMCQRVGFARALIMQPEVLLLDEPFSALDAVTARNLTRDFMQLWNTRKIKTKSVLMVTHDILEAIKMADRLIVLSSNPGRVIEEIVIDRTKLNGALRAQYSHDLSEHIFKLLS